MARHWVQEMPAETRRSTWSTAPVPDMVDEPDADVRPIVPAARRPAPAEAGAPEVRTA